MEVAVVSKEIIKPSSSTVHHLEPYKLSFFSQLTPTTYSPLIFFYPAVDANPKNITLKIMKLKRSLSEVLNLYYPYSGRLVDNHYIDRFNEGVPFFVAHVNGRLSDFLKNPEIEFLNRFLPCQPFTKEDMGVPQVAFQVNVFSCGGIAISSALSHKLTDAPSGCALIHSWAAISRGTLSEVVKPNCTESSIFFPPKNPFPEEHLSLMERLWFTEANYITRRFVFNAKAIASLRVKAKGEREFKPTRVEALSCFIWKCCMAISLAISGSPKPSILVEAVNLRTRTKPTMSNVSLGDVFWWATALADTSQQNRELHELASLLDEAIAQYNSDYMQSLQGDGGFETMSEYCDQLQGLFASENPDIFAFTSWCHLGVRRVNFGWGNPVWVGILGKAGPAFRNLTVFAEAIDGKGIEAWITLDEERMALLERDPEFLTYASTVQKISSL
ncbi:stemmadenine O-acetyltransferase [Manihot esculenta]|uniref:Uncharacterized protein n=1 Tax=Manihot esculenta TaxID=3983 RepID=A0A2C9WA18_MANES|nr:stemmadenine O-acetyltransferase [Manihot esculenta]OAY55335.1 hypothetical protein MANES_03G146200v8 [Manihot esculenta]